MAFMRDWSSLIAATSPRTHTIPNVLNASSVMAKTAQGYPHRQVVGPGTTLPSGEPGISEHGYPMMTELNPPPGKSRGTIGLRLDDVLTGGGIDPNTSPKPFMFGANLRGNPTGVTVDTHVIRGIIKQMNDMDPGSVPLRFIDKKFKKAYYKKHKKKN